MRDRIARHHKAKNKKKKIIISSVFILIPVIAFSIGVTYSRYVTTLEEVQVLVPENFYFESNYLGEVGADTEEEVLSFNVYTDYVEIEIRNHDLVQYSENDITYTLTYEIENEYEEDEPMKEALITDITDGTEGTGVTGGTDDTDESGPTVISDLVLGTSDTTENEDPTLSESVTHTFKLTADPGTIVTVTATSSAPYEKTITAQFKFQDPGNQTFYEIVDMGYYCYLNIYTGEDIGEGDIETITIDYITALFSPDNMDPMMEDWKIVTLYEAEDESEEAYELWEDDEYRSIFTDEAQATLSETIDVYQGDSGNIDDDADMPTETELVPNGYYSLVFFENTLKNYSPGQHLLEPVEREVPVEDGDSEPVDGEASGEDETLESVTEEVYVIDLTKLPEVPEVEEESEAEES